MKTRLRRWYWSAIRPGGHPLEYTGDPFEKLLGFLIAVVFLAFYIGIVNLLLMFISFSLFQGNFAAYLLSFLGVVPLWFYATYRARRYVLARTRWRGVRFGVDAGAWGYTWRALLHWSATILTLGLLWPRMTFWLEKYRTDRTWYGSAQLSQGGTWKMLYVALKPVFASLVVAAAAAAAFFTGHQGMGIGLGVIAGLWFLYGIVHYNVESFRILTNHKTAAGVALDAAPRATRVLGIYIVGYMLTGIVLMIPLVLLGGILAIQFGGNIGLEDIPSFDNAPQWLLFSVTIALYFSIFLFWSVFSHTLVTMPKMRHYATTLKVLNTPALAAISQRDRDEFQEAEGFAEALDLGASI